MEHHPEVAGTDPKVARYRDRLREASVDLPPDVRDDLFDDVEAHLAWREKLMGTLVVPGGLAAPFYFFAVGVASFSQVCEQESFTDATGATLWGPEVCTGAGLPAWIALAMLIVTVAGPIVVAVVLLRRARGRS